MTNEELKTAIEQEIAKCQAIKDTCHHNDISYWSGRIHSYEEVLNMLDGTFTL